MTIYRLAGKSFLFFSPLPSLKFFREAENEELVENVGILLQAGIPEEGNLRLISKTSGFVGNALRKLEVYETTTGMVLKLEECGEYLVCKIEKVLCVQAVRTSWESCDQDVILGPGLVLALALDGIWTFHTSAAMFRGKVVVCLGESGQGKSTLSAYLSKNSGWNLVADDMLPTAIVGNELRVLPHFPQLKVPMKAQPGLSLPEYLPLDNICILTPAARDATPELYLLPPRLAVQALLGHTAGTRMFTPQMLGKHLSFCSQVATQVPVYQLSYPHRKEALPQIKELLESIC